MTEAHVNPHVDVLQSGGLEGRRSSYTTFVASMGAFLDGYDLIIISGALLFIKPEMHLGPGIVGWVGSIAFAGMAVGALLFGRLADRIGRNAAFGFVLALFVVGAVVSALATSPAVLLAGRALVGLGIGADLPISTTLIAESVPSSSRGRLTGLLQAYWFGGAAVSGAASIGFYYALGSASWRWMLASAGVIAVIVMILRMSVPESPRWLAARTCGEDSAREHRRSASTGGGARRLFTIHRVRSALGFSCLFWFAVTVRGAGFNLYTPTFLKQVGLSGVAQSLGLSAAINGVYAVIVILCVVYVDRVPRRSGVLWCWGAATVLTVGLAAINPGQAIPMFLLILVSAIPTQPMSMLLFPLSVEPFPTLVRGTAQGFSSASGKVGGFIAALAFPTLLASLGWRDLSLALTGFMVLALLVGLFLKVPETRGRRLEELEEEAMPEVSSTP